MEAVFLICYSKIRKQNTPHFKGIKGKSSAENSAEKENNMKNILTAVIAMAVIIAVRIILSLTVSEQVAAVFSETSIGALILYFVLQTGKAK